MGRLLLGGSTQGWRYSRVAVLKGGGTTQAKRLDQLPARLVEVIKLMTGKTVPADEVTLDIDYGDGLGRVAAELRNERAAAEAVAEHLQEQTVTVIRKLRASGASVRDIGTMTGLSHQRVSQVVSGSEPTSRAS
jgi:hypothetical protein